MFVILWWLRQPSNPYNCLSIMHAHSDDMESSVKIFDTEEEAEKFAEAHVRECFSYQIVKLD